MKAQNKHLVRFRISERKYREIIKYFAFVISPRDAPLPPAISVSAFDISLKRFCVGHII